MRKKNIKKYLKILAKCAGFFLLLTVGVFFIFRNILLNTAIEKLTVRLQARYNIAVKIKEVSFNGLTGVNVSGISVVPEGRDTLLHIDTLRTKISLWHALLGDIRVKKMYVSHGFLKLIQQDSIKNFDIFFRQRPAVPQETHAVSAKRIHFAKTTYRIINSILNQLPVEWYVSAFNLNIIDQTLFTCFSIENMEQHADKIAARITVSDNHAFQQHWNLSGTANLKEKKADIRFYNIDSGKAFIPYINSKFNLVNGFDSIHIKLDEISLRGNELHISGYSGITNLLVNHPKISKKDVVVDNASVNYHVLLGENFISLDSSTTVKFNNVLFHPFVKLDMEKDTVFNFAVKIPKMSAQDFITSLPEGLFKHFTGMEVAGEFEYKFNLIFNENRPQDLVFESHLKKYGLSVLKYGEANLNKLNGEFVYVPIEYGKPQRPIWVGSTNAYYTPLDQISLYLQKAVLTTEDPSFFYHRGFIDEAFRQSIIKNIRERKFARGASTISMQLVKNVFLTREKTLSRKMEEILLVYILENNRISSKERMLEVYFNIIEWGPGVYGIGEAAEFYFNKKPSQLTLEESLFLATIIPRPKGFMWWFDKEAKLKPFAERQFAFLTNLMVKRNVLMPEDTIALSRPIHISGKAKSFIKIDTTMADTIILMNPDGTLRLSEEED